MLHDVKIGPWAPLLMCGLCALHICPYVIHNIWVWPLAFIVTNISVHDAIQIGENKIFNIILTLYGIMTFDLGHDLWPVDYIYRFPLIVCYISAHTVI